jgi:hypothetical protein
LLINGVLQPVSSYVLRSIGSVPGCAGMNSFLFNWKLNTAVYGTNLLQLFYTNGITSLNAIRSVIVAPPPRIAGLTGNHQVVVWDSAPGVHYQVLATTNLTQPFVPISPVIPATNTSSTFFDPSPSTQKFYAVEVVY